jgi:hypothetical protein
MPCALEQPKSGLKTKRGPGLPKNYSLIFLAVSQWLHGIFVFVHKLFVIGHVIIFSFNQRFSPSFMALETSVSIVFTNRKSFELTCMFTIANFFQPF